MVRSYTRRVAQAPALPRGFELPLKQRLPRIGSIDQVAVEARAGELAKRSIKKDAKVWALELALRCCDLTTLEGQDTPGKVAALCSKAVRPDPSDPSIPSVAAVCVYPNLVATAKERLQGSGVKVASVATAFPSGQSALDVKVRDVEEAVAGRRRRDRHGDRPRRVPLRAATRRSTTRSCGSRKHAATPTSR